MNPFWTGFAIGILACFSIYAVALVSALCFMARDERNE